MTRPDATSTPPTLMAPAGMSPERPGEPTPISAMTRAAAKRATAAAVHSTTRGRGRPGSTTGGPPAVTSVVATSPSAVPQREQNRSPARLTKWHDRHSARGAPHEVQKRESSGLSAPQAAHAGIGKACHVENGHALRTTRVGVVLFVHETHR